MSAVRRIQGMAKGAAMRDSCTACGWPGEGRRGMGVCRGLGVVREGVAIGSRFGAV